MKPSVFRSAVTGSDGTVDPGYLALFSLMAIICGTIPVMCVGELMASWLDSTHEFNIQALGIGVGAVCAGFATVVGAVGAFRMGDKPRVGVTETSQQSSKTVTAPTVP